MFLREIFEAPKVAAFAFGRMNPPTVGHAKLVDKIKSQEGEPFLFLTHTQKPKTDPLSFDEKVFFAQRSFTGVTIGDQKVRTIIDAMQFLEAKGYSDIIYVAGSDRVAQFEKLLNTYNGKDYNFNSIKIVSAGQRDPDAEGAEGMSASKMKAAAAENNFETFKSGVAGDEKLAQMMFNKVRAGMGVQENLDELVVKQQKPKLDVLNNIASRTDGKPFPLSWSADSNEISVGGKIYIAPARFTLPGLLLPFFLPSAKFSSNSFLLQLQCGQSGLQAQSSLFTSAPQHLGEQYLSLTSPSSCLYVNLKPKFLNKFAVVFALLNAFCISS